MNHYHDAAIEEEIKIIENDAFLRAVNVAMDRYIRLWRFLVPDRNLPQFTYYDLLDQRAEDEDFLRKHPLPPDDLTPHDRYHAINNECERLVG